MTMGITIDSCPLDGVVVLIPDTFRDNRGFFIEAYRADRFAELKLPSSFVQENHSGSRQGVIRGLHFQWDPPMGKLMRVTVGKAFLVAVDIRKGSPSLGKWCGVEASAENRRQVWAPAGFARGFCAMSELAEVQYQVTGLYNPRAESCIRWDDPEIGINWPTAAVLVSEKDRNAQTLSEWMRSPLSENFKY